MVFMAGQTQPFQRRVTVKVIRVGMGTNQVIARFEAEKQALAVMDHGNIDVVRDTGTVGKPARCPAKSVQPTTRPTAVDPARTCFLQKCWSSLSIA